MTTMLAEPKPGISSESFGLVARFRNDFSGDMVDDLEGVVCSTSVVLMAGAMLICAINCCWKQRPSLAPRIVALW